jgi:pimeloyl-ACP methyl ester carboxylesterase
MAVQYLPTSTASGVTAYYRRAGRGRPLILLHGWGGSSSLWQETLHRLADGHDVIAPDLPGFGQSAPMSGPLSIERLADWVLAFADRLGLATFDLNGHSLSGAVAVHVAARRPRRVRRLVLTGFSTFKDERERKLVDAIHHVIALWLSLRRPWMAERDAFVRLIGGRFVYQLPTERGPLREAMRDFMRMDKRTALETARGAGNPAISTALAAVDVPALVIAGRNDQIMPPAGAPVAAQRLRFGRLQWIERCGHLPMLEYPQEYHRLLADFLDAPAP